jgi:hypothetical protein
LREQKRKDEKESYAKRLYVDLKSKFKWRAPCELLIKQLVRQIGGREFAEEPTLDVLVYECDIDMHGSEVANLNIRACTVSQQDLSWGRPAMLVLQGF